ncbi:LysR family transcriptional regulator [Limimaricola pyoseonensis]|uniref:DNA-binding transcriptional regulator, LysR family n=1 Tax=Limimaricola pyoseonensis TaxID=521013 RepID=A0A1G7G953_9RHOB|nr:LysR family transcriptional regulator [Limimaricola pyoseonensis]SDE84633.1 DNA-binding transcriptional regulator, LysR family [Limimaricola pyoseonensis]
MIERLEMFLALAKARHFGRAAEAMGVTQPTLSAAIRQLEDTLGVKLVVRGSRFQGLTPEGERVLAWARRITGDMRGMKEELRAAREGLTGTLRLAVIPTALGAVARLTARVSAAHPKLRFALRSATTAELLSAIEDHEADAGIGYLDGEPLGRVVTQPLYTERYVAVMRSDAALARIEPLRWADLATAELCLLTPDMQNRRIVAGHLRAAGVEVAPRVETNSTIVLISHVLTAGWVTILPERAAEIFLRGQPLVARPLTAPDAAHEIGLIAPWREPHGPLVEALLAEARRFSLD